MKTKCSDSTSTLRPLRPSGRESGEKLFVEKFIIDPRETDLSRTGIMNGYEVFGNVILMTTKEKTMQVQRGCRGRRGSGGAPRLRGVSAPGRMWADFQGSRHDLGIGPGQNPGVLANRAQSRRRTGSAASLPVAVTRTDRKLRRDTGGGFRRPRPGRPLQQAGSSFSAARPPFNPAIIRRKT